MADQYYDAIELIKDGQNIDDEVVDYQDTTETATKAVKTMGRTKRAKGYKSSSTMHSFDLTVETLVSPRVNWRDMVKKKTIFQLMLKPNNGGPREQLIDCRATKFTRTQSDGDGNYKVSCLALDHK